MTTTLGGRYQIIREIGVGGMGRVFQAVDSQTGRTVAAKVLIASEGETLDSVLRFHQEGALLSTLHHPNIVQLYATFLEEHTSCIIMELLEGQSLAHILKTERLSLPRIQKIAQQVAEALLYAHGRGVIHRDVKPDNIMVVGDDHVKVTDFGIARLANPLGTLPTMTKPGMSIGTPHYMAPEQIEGGQVDGRADVYSLGAVLYHMVTGRPPFEGDDPLTIAFKQVHRAPTPPHDINADLPLDWEALILRALAKDPADRFQSATAIRDAIAVLGAARSTAAAQTAPLPGGGPAAPPSGVPASLQSAVGASTTQALASGNSGQTQDAAATRQVRPVITPAAWRTRWWAVAAGAVVVAVLVVALLALLNRGGGKGTAAPTAVPPTGPAGQLAALRVIATWGTLGTGPVQFAAPEGVVVDRTGDIVVADTGNDRIQELAASSDPLDQWGVHGSEISQFDRPAAVAVDAQRNVYVVDTGNNRIQKFSFGGKLLSVWGAQGSGSSQLNLPAGIAVAPGGELYVADTGNDRIVEFSPDGKVLGSWGSAGSAPGQFNRPTGIAIDSAGDIYVADTGNDRIQVFASTTDPLEQWGKSGSAPGEFNRPEGVALDARGRVFVADTGNDRVQELTSGGRPRAILSKQGSGRSPLKHPSAIAVDSHGVYVADTGNNRIVKLSPVP